MYHNSKRIITLVVLLVLFYAGQAVGQTRVLGLFQLGKSTYDEVKSHLPNGVKVKGDEGKSSDYNDGPAFYTTGTGYGIDGLETIMFCFDKKQILAEVRMFLIERRLQDIKKILSSKYQQVRSYPGVWLLFKANRDYVYLEFPRDKEFIVDYMTDSTYRQEQLMERQTAEDKKELERREQKRLERKQVEEAAKF